MRAFILVGLGWLCAGAAQGAEVPHPLDSDKRLGELQYQRDQVFQIPVGFDVATHIVLENGEQIISSAPGAPADCRADSSLWCIVANVGSADVFVKPKSAAAQSNNLELITNRRLYSLHFVQGARLGGVPAMFRVTFRYPAAPEGERVAAAASGGPCNWGYTMRRSSNADRLAPLAVFDDGRQLYLMLPASAQMPEIYAGAAGQMKLAPQRIGQRLLAVPADTPPFTLKVPGAAVEIRAAQDGEMGACPSFT